MTTYHEGDFSWIDEPSERRWVQNMYIAAVENGLMEWFRTEKPPADKGYMLWNVANIRKLMSHPLVNADGHSGYTAAYCCRMIQAIATDGWDHVVKQRLTK